MLEDTENQGENSDGEGDGDDAGDGGGDGGNTNPNENQNSAGEDGGKSESEGSDEGQQGEGGDGDNKEGESQEPPRGESLLDLFRKDPQAQELVRAQAQQWVSSQQTAAAVETAQKEIDGLINDEDFEELGKRFAKDTVTNRAGKVQADAALQEAFGGVYRELFALPELQNLTTEEKASLEASKFTSDAEYIPALLKMVVAKRVGGTLDETVNNMLTEKLKVLENMAGAGNANGSGSPNIPGGATGGNLEGKSSRDLLSQGWAGILEKAGYPNATDED